MTRLEEVIGSSRHAKSAWEAFEYTHELLVKDGLYTAEQVQDGFLTDYEFANSNEPQAERAYAAMDEMIARHKAGALTQLTREDIEARVLLAESQEAGSAYMKGLKEAVRGTGTAASGFLRGAMEELGYTGDGDITKRVQDTAATVRTVGGPLAQSALELARKAAAGAATLVRGYAGRQGPSPQPAQKSAPKSQIQMYGDIAVKYAMIGRIDNALSSIRSIETCQESRQLPKAELDARVAKAYQSCITEVMAQAKARVDTYFKQPNIESLAADMPAYVANAIRLQRQGCPDIETKDRIGAELFGLAQNCYRQGDSAAATAINGLVRQYIADNYEAPAQASSLMAAVRDLAKHLKQ